MALRKLRFKPGINRDITDYAQEGGWYASNKVRFFKGFPRKIGGWTKHSITKFYGICRSIFAFSGLNGSRYLALGTNEKVLLNQQGNNYDITPIRATAGAGNITFAATNGSSTITANDTGHGAAVGDWVTFSGAANLYSSGGTITAAILNKEYKIDAISSSNAFTFTALDANGDAIAANANDSGNGGGSSDASYQLSIGNESGTEGLGWGAGAWNAEGATGGGANGGWNEPRAGTGIFMPMRIVYFTRYQDDLLFNVRYGDIYRWVWQNTPSARAALLSASPSSGTEVPEEVTQVLIAQDNQSNIILALGCTPYPASGSPDRDPLLIRWSDISNPFNFTPSDLTTAGSLSVQNGSHILRGVPTTRETLIFTESTLNSLKFTGTFDVFRLDEISSYTSLVGPNAVATVDGVTYWMGLNKFYRYDGRVNTLDCTVQDEIFENYNLDQSDQIFAALNSEYHEVWWFYPAAGAKTITNYVTYNYLENVWFYGDCDGASEGDASFSRTAWQDAGIYNKPHSAASNHYVYKHENGNNAPMDVAFASPFITTGDAGSGNITVTTEAVHGASIGDTVLLSGAVTVDGITAAQINKKQTITAVPTNTSFTVETAGSASSGNTSGGGSGVATFPHLPLASFITSAQLSIDQGDRFVLMSRVIPDIDFRYSNASTDTISSTGGAEIVPSINFSVFAKKYPGAATYTANESGESLTDTVTAANVTTVDQFTEQAYMRARGRSLAFKIESTEKNVAWELGVPRVDFRQDGRRG